MQELQQQQLALEMSSDGEGQPQQVRAAKQKRKRLGESFAVLRAQSALDKGDAEARKSCALEAEYQRHGRFMREQVCIICLHVGIIMLCHQSSS